MFKKFVKNYYKLCDKKIGSGVPIVVVITILIASVGNIANASASKVSTKNECNGGNTVVINGKCYRLVD